MVHLFVEDECDKLSKRKFTETVSLTVLDTTACQSHKFRVNPRDVLDRLKGILHRCHGVWSESQSFSPVFEPTFFLSYQDNGSMRSPGSVARWILSLFHRRALQ